MALPKVNDVPKYDLVIPSTGEQVRYRPFLVKEQKILLLAMESNDQKGILSSITDTIESCLMKLDRLTSFDVEYIFSQIRAKSVGETSTVGFHCTNCESVNDVTIDISSLTIDVPKRAKKSIKLTDQFTVVMKYPSYKTMIDSELEVDTAADQIYGTVIACLDKLKTEEEIIDFADEPKAEVEQFLEQLTTEQFTSIMEFVQNIPTLKHEVKFNCTECGESNTSILQGLSDFF